ncbi:MAG: HlyD family efflux transporter periplasmic adaptor subunit [Lachnospiraceae bacterium]|nr:HlyD family efflux transporter periplasmic adaptor subunit [Lachnospiraceae bacterium]
MNENNKKKREWVKTAAIIFLSVLLVLTFFSNTIMNYSLPEVAAQYVQSGSITAKIRGTGVVESDDPYEVMVKETRKVSSVAVKVGDVVQKGDVLLYLDGTESEELKAAQELVKGAEALLEEAQDAYDTALLAVDINAQIIQNAGSNIGTVSYRQQISDAQAAVELAQKDVDAWQAQYDKVTTQLTTLPENSADTTKEIKALNDALTVQNAAEAALLVAQNDLATKEAEVALEKERYDPTVTGGDAKLNALLAEKLQLQEAVIAKQDELYSAQEAYDKALAALEAKQSTGDNAASINALKREQNTASVNLEAMKKVLSEKEAYLAELGSSISKTLNLQSLWDAVVDAREMVAKAQEEVAKQEAKAMGSTVTADIAGTVTVVNAVAGREVSAAEAVAILQPEGQGYTMSFSVTNEQAQRLAVGDVADLVNAWRYDDVTVVLTSIRPDPTDPGRMKLLTFNVTGNIVAGQTLNVSVGQKSANYDLIVPNSAIREDNNGKFILIVESQSSPLGNRYRATRADVEVLASDDTQSAIRGALMGYEFVITTSNKPVETGQLVRLPEN